METKTFFNLPSATAASDLHGHYFGLSPKQNVQTNWHTFEDQPMSLESLIDVFANRIPVFRVPGWLSPEECERMMQIMKTHDIVGTPNDGVGRRPVADSAWQGSYDTENTWPRVGVAGITQYDNINGKSYWTELCIAELH